MTTILTAAQIAKWCRKRRASLGYFRIERHPYRWSLTIRNAPNKRFIYVEGRTIAIAHRKAERALRRPPERVTDCVCVKCEAAAIRKAEAEMKRRGK